MIDYTLIVKILVNMYKIYFYAIKIDIKNECLLTEM